MRFRFFLATVILTLASSFAFPCLGSAGEADVSLKTDPKTSTPLPSLVEQYLTVSDLDAAEIVLTKILQYPDADCSVGVLASPATSQLPSKAYR